MARYVAGLPLVVVMPDAGRGFYTNAVAGFAYEDDLIGDVIGLVERTFPVRAERTGRAIGGLSMGGYGAVKLALKHPTLFASAHSHSGALGVARPEVGAIRDLFPEFARVFGTAPTDGPDDPFALAARVGRDLLPSLRLDCGTEDFLLDQSRAFHARLDTLAIPHEYHEGRGGHDWDYWDRQIQHAIAFHKRNLGLD